VVIASEAAQAINGDWVRIVATMQDALASETVAKDRKDVDFGLPKVD